MTVMSKFVMCNKRQSYTADFGPDVIMRVIKVQQNNNQSVCESF